MRVFGSIRAQHDPSEPVGIWLDLREDHRGLIARGRLIPKVARGRELLSLLRAGRASSRTKSSGGGELAQREPGERARRHRPQQQGQMREVAALGEDADEISHDDRA